MDIIKNNTGEALVDKGFTSMPKRFVIMEDSALYELTIAAIQGAASQLAARHDFKVEVMAKHAVAVAKAVIEELRKA